MVKFKFFLSILLSLCSFSAIAYDFESGGIYYKVSSTNDKTVAVTYKDTKYNSYAGEIEIPSNVINDDITYSVTSIGGSAFDGCSGLTSVTIPESVTSIGSNAFWYCTSLTSVTIPNSVTSIGFQAFYGCSGITSVTIPESVTSIYQSAFKNCIGLTTVNFNATNCIRMGDYSDNVFKGCSSLITVTFGDNVSKIPDYAFKGCTGLTSVSLPNSVTSIGACAFQDCSSLTEVSLPNSVISLGGAAFCGCTSLTTIEIPNSVTSIGGSAFCNCSSLTSVSIPNSVSLIYSDTFRGCTSLTTIEIPNSVTSIGFYAFEGCSGLTSVTIGNSITSIDRQAFFGCTGLISFYGKYASPDNRCLIKDGQLIAFAPSGLSEYSIPESVISIGEYAFYGCSNLSSIEIPNSVTSIGYYSFSGCSSLPSIEIPNSVSKIEPDAFKNCSGLTSVTIPNSVTSIGYYAFDSCSGLTTVTIGNSVTYIDDSAFGHCMGLTTVNFNATNCTSMGREEDPVFNGSSSLATVTIGDNVSNIPHNAFYGCSGITTVTIPNSVVSIGHRAFYGCSGMTSMTVKNDKPANISLDYDVFAFFPTSTCILYVPDGSKSRYAAAAQWKAFTNIVEFNKPDLLADGEAYTATEDQYGVDVNYTRNFTNTEWQPLYVPFNMSYEEWNDKAEVAEVHNVLGYDNDNDGIIDDIIIEFNKVTSGEINPNVPYVIKAKNTGEVTFECTGKTVLAAPAEEGTVECSSTKMTYSFHGVYQPKTDMFTSGAYHLSGGAFHHTTTDEAVLPPFRFYMMVTPKTGGYNPAAAPQMIKMKVDGEDVTTSIVGVEVDVQDDGIYYDMMGRKVVNPAQGIYIRNGKKVVVK